jgi:hypothetical protein
MQLWWDPDHDELEGTPMVQYFLHRYQCLADTPDTAEKLTGKNQIKNKTGEQCPSPQNITYKR